MATHLFDHLCDCKPCGDECWRRLRAGEPVCGGMFDFGITRVERITVRYATVLFGDFLTERHFRRESPSLSAEWINLGRVWPSLAGEVEL